MCGNFSKDEIDSLYKVIFSRRDVRSGFTGEPIKDEVLRRILDAAHMVIQTPTLIMSCMTVKFRAGSLVG